MQTENKNILFVCTGNTCRSTLAEAYLRKRAREENLHVQVKSAGLAAIDGMMPSQEAVEVLKEENIPVEGLVSKMLKRSMLEWADMVIVMENMHKQAIVAISPGIREKVFLLGEFPNGATEKEVSDPVGKSKEVYKKTFGLIKGSVEELIRWLKTSL